MNKKLIVEEVLNCDTARLYGSLSNAIDYLKEIQVKYPDASLHEHWTGYEDMTMSFLHTRPETDKEMEIRIQREEYDRKIQQQEDQRKKQRQEDFKKLEALKRKLGVR